MVQTIGASSAHLIKNLFVIELLLSRNNLFINLPIMIIHQLKDFNIYNRIIMMMTLVSSRS